MMFFYNNRVTCVVDGLFFFILNMFVARFSFLVSS